MLTQGRAQEGLSGEVEVGWGIKSESSVGRAEREGGHRAEDTARAKARRQGRVVAAWREQAWGQMRGRCKGVKTCVWGQIMKGPE